MTDLQSVRGVWQDKCQWESCAVEAGVALLFGEWWRAAETLSDARRRAPARSAWVAWLSEIPLSESHAGNLIRLHRHGLATPALSIREALALLGRK